MTALAPTNPGEWSLGALNTDSGWIDLRGVAEPFCFNITGTFVGTITLEESNQSDATKTRTSTRATYTSTTASLEIKPSTAKFIRFKMTLYTSGTAYIGTARVKDQAGRLFDLTDQSASAEPAGTYS